MATAEPEDARSAFPIVGVVSSAGGLDALQRLFAAVPSAPGAAFVVVPHLDPARASIMAELIARHTTLPVVEATDGVRVAVDHVYLIPPNATMRLRGGALRLTAPGAGTGAAESLDDFLVSLADDVGPRAIGVVLSGTGTHGTRGLGAVRAAGGRTFAQTPASAAFPSMPQAAIDAGGLDAALPPEALPAALGEPRAARTTGSAPAVPADRAAVLRLIAERTGRDFTSYRPGMLTRRIERRIGLRGLSGLADYLGLLRDQPAELDALVGDLLIGVTSFFRDPDAFDVFARVVVPEVLRAKPPGADVRAWVPGCSTGEEAYSVAMLLLEALDARGAGAGCAQVFATDVDGDALASARAGVYASSALEGLPPARRERFFAPEGDRLRVSKSLRDAVVFAPQNVLTDPPFSRLDIVCCRNLLIYLEPDAQQRVLGQFAFALTPGGFLFLGPAEALGAQAELFETVSGPWRVFRRTGRASPVRIGDLGTTGATAPPAPAPTSASAGPTWHPAELVARALAEFAPAAFLVDAAGLVEYACGPTGRYTELPTGEPSRDLLALVRGGLRATVREALAAAPRGTPPPVYAWVERDGAFRPVRVSVRPVSRHPLGRASYLIVFEEAAPDAPADPLAGALVRHLEHELRAERDELNANAAANQSAKEELRAANEEMISVNEELQSTVEELETSKEELQSLNEELITTNAQLRDKGEALAIATADITGLLHGTDIAALIVGSDGLLRRFTPAATRLFHLISADVGRPLTDIAHTMLDATLHEELRAAARARAPLPDREVAAPGDRWFLRRVLPYSGADGRADGVLVTFTDVTTLKRAEQELRRNKELVRLAAVLMDSADAIALVEDDGRVSAWNRGAERLYGYAEREAVGLPFKALVPGTHRAADLAALDAVRRGEPVPPWETCRVARNGRVLDVLVTASRLGGRDGGAPAVSLIERDQTDLKKLLVDLQFRSDRTAAILEAAADPIVTLDSSGIIESVNPATERLFGWPVAELVGRHIGALVPGELRARDGRALAPPLAAVGEVIAQEVACLHRDGTAFVADLSAGQVDHMPLFVWIFRDATVQKRLEREVLEIAADAQERIGRELHDSVGQELTGLRLMVESLIAGLREHGSDELGLAERIGEGLRETLGRVRQLSCGLVAAETDGQGLPGQLEAVVERVRATSPARCAFELAGPAPPLDPPVATHLLRIAQEAVANALRHSGAAHVSVALSTAGGTTELRVRDDGTGFAQPADAPAVGLGLKLMRYRAGLIGARLRVESGPSGTVVTCTLPYHTGAEP